MVSGLVSCDCVFPLRLSLEEMRGGGASLPTNITSCLAYVEMLGEAVTFIQLVLLMKSYPICILYLV